MSGDLVKHAPYVVWTGHPPPLRQIEGQIRCSTGVTYRAPKPPAVRDNATAPRAADRPTEPMQWLSLPDRVLAYLLLQEGGFLPSLLTIVEDVAPSMGNIHAHNRILHALQALEHRGVLELWRGSVHGYRGAYAVRLAGGAGWLRGAGVPAGKP